MKTLFRLMSVCSVAMAGVLAVPSVASADSGVEMLGTTSQAHSHGGKERMFKRALEQVQLRPEQKTQVDKLMEEGRERHAAAKQAKGEFMRALADQIDSGKIDRCKLAPQTKALASAMAKTRPGDRAAMEKLHDILDSTQRGRFVEALQQEWQRAERSHSPDAIVDYLDDQLELTDDQESRLREVLTGLKQIREAEPGHAEKKEMWKRILEGFKGEQFDIEKIAPSDSAKDEERAMHRIEGRLWAGEAILPILDEAQRSKIANLLREKAQRHTGSENGAQGAERRMQKGPPQGREAQENEQQENEQQEEEEEEAD